MCVGVSVSVCTFLDVGVLLQVFLTIINVFGGSRSLWRRECSRRKILKTVLEISHQTLVIYICIFNDFYCFQRVLPLMGPKL